ncbi:MAG: hypothetical protein PHP65_05610 [Bacilli bacterium]|nr:hypothetical protein [Bacilli bacterium]
MKIHFLSHDKIDKKLYDSTVESSPYKVIYAMSWYLDAVSPGWDLLMSEHYKYVMPLPVKKRYGIKYIITPFFCQQLGLFSSVEISESELQNFIKTIPSIIFSLQFNTGNRFTNLKAKQRSNFVLPLNKSYELLQSAYNNNFLRCVKKAKKSDFIIEKEMLMEDYKTLLRENSPDPFIQKIAEKMDSFVTQINKHVRFEIRNIKTKDQQMLSSVLFVFWEKRIYYLCPVSTQKGKDLFSMHYLLDNIIKEYSESDYVLDLEGSNIPSIARFYHSIGAKEEFYYLLEKPQCLFNLKSKI